MRDGITSATDLYIPEGDGPFPVLLDRTPYDKSSFQSQHVAGLEFVRALDAGFAVVVQDTRGRWASDGEFTPFVAEPSDGLDTVDATQLLLAQERRMATLPWHPSSPRPSTSRTGRIARGLYSSGSCSCG